MNNNCLEGMRCPKCGFEDRFHITATVFAVVTDDGIEDYGDSEWDADSYCGCGGCDYHGTVRDYYIPETPLQELVEGVFK